MKKTFLSLVFFILYSAFCFSSAPPDWEANTKKKYPDKDFILGFGEGKSREEARQNALVEVSESIVVLVEAETHGHSYKTQDDLKYTSNSSIAKDITTLTKNELFAVHYDWYPNKKEKYYVCAYINKKEVFEIVSSKLSSHEQNFLQKMGFIKAENDVLTKIIFLHEALSQENEIKLLHDYYKIIASEKKERFDELIKLVDES